MQSETLAQEFARLVKEYHEGDDHTKPEAWNLLADYAVDNADAISAALSDKQAGEVKIKPLEWTGLLSPREDGPAEPTGDIEAATLIGEYSVCLDEDEGVSETPWCAWSPVENIGHFESLEAAKAAAQSDYETRIRSALVDVPAVESEPVAWLVRDNDDEEFRVAFIDPDICWQKAPLYTTHAGRNALDKERGG